MKVSDGELSKVTDEDIINGTFSFPEGVNRIRDHTFEAHTSLRSINIPNGIETIPNWGFRGCTGLESIHFPEGLKTIFDAAFSGCTSLKSVSFPNGFIAIGWAAFSGCTSLQSVFFSDGFKTIGSSAFQRCTSLQHITLPKIVEIIEERAFADCPNLESIHFAGSVNEIAYGVFSGCTSLESIRFLGGVNKIGNNAFADCPNLSYIYLSSSNENERQQVMSLLPESLRCRIVPQAFEQKLPDMLNNELGRILEIPASNAIRRSTKSIGFFPEDVCIEINKQTNPRDHAFYQKARREINKLALPTNKNDFTVYKNKVKAVVNMVIERAKRGLCSPDEVSVSSNTTNS